MYQAGDVRVETVPDPVLREPTDAIVRVTSSCICGSDLWPYQSMAASAQGRRMGHEFIGVVEELGADVVGLKRGDLVVAPFLWADNTCDFCREGLHTSCRHGGGWGSPGVDGGQGEAVRVPQADGTLVKLPVAPDSALTSSLLTLSDVFCTGHHGAVTARVEPGRTVTDVVAERGEAGIDAVRELTRGDGTHAVIECVGTEQSLATALGVVRDGGIVSRLGVSQYRLVPMDFGTMIEPGRVFDRTIGVDEVPEGYRAMADRAALKVLIKP